MQRIYHNGKRLLWAAALASLFLAASTARANDPLPACHVLSIGVENYPKQKKLPGCANDAIYLANRFKAQEGKLFGKVYLDVRVKDNEIRRQDILKAMDRLSQQGKAGDWVVLIASGHNCGTGTNWGFMAVDEQQVSGRDMLNLADTLASEGKKVIILIDACFSGQLRIMARDVLQRHTEPARGGIVLLTASMAGQTSVCLSNKGYSAFAKAVDEALDGQADFNGDGVVTLKEVRSYAQARVHKMLGIRSRTARSTARRRSRATWPWPGCGRRCWRSTAV